MDNKFTWFNYKMLKKVRESELGLTQSAVAKLLGVTVLSYQKWEYGKSLPRIDNLAKFIVLAETKGYKYNVDDWIDKDKLTTEVLRGAK